MKNQHRQGNRQHDFFHVLNGHGLGRQFAQDNVPGSDDGKGDDQRQRMPHHIVQACQLCERQDKLRHHGLTNPAKPQGRQRNPQLRHRQRGVKMVCEPFCIHRPAAAFGNQRFQSGRTDFHTGKLRRHKKTVHKYQKCHEYQLQ